MESHVGCYETGSLDFFGPLCVVACYVDQKDEKELNELGLDKEMSSRTIRDPRLNETFRHSTAFIGFLYSSK